MLERLSPAQREVIALRVAAGLSSDQVAAILGISGAGVRVAQHRALRKPRTLAGEIPEEATGSPDADARPRSSSSTSRDAPAAARPVHARPHLAWTVTAEPWRHSREVNSNGISVR